MKKYNTTGDFINTIEDAWNLFIVILCSTGIGVLIVLITIILKIYEEWFVLYIPLCIAVGMFSFFLRNIYRKKSLGG